MGVWGMLVWRGVVGSGGPLMWCPGVGEAGVVGDCRSVEWGGRDKASCACGYAGASVGRWCSLRLTAGREGVRGVDDRPWGWGCRPAIGWRWRWRSLLMWEGWCVGGRVLGDV